MDPDVMEHLQTSGQLCAACAIHNVIAISCLRYHMTPGQRFFRKRVSQQFCIFDRDLYLS